jgi:hypothetical protein
MPCCVLIITWCLSFNKSCILPAASFILPILYSSCTVPPLALFTGKCHHVLYCLQQPAYVGALNALPLCCNSCQGWSLGSRAASPACLQDVFDGNPSNCVVPGAMPGSTHAVRRPSSCPPSLCKDPHPGHIAAARTGPFHHLFYPHD